jgi:uncharacterized OB-fold protein
MNAATRDVAAVIRQYGGDPTVDMPFWEGCRAGRFLLHRCGICQRAYWPASRCVVHGDTSMAWVECAGVGTLYTYTVLHKAYTSAMQDKVPYVVGVIQLAEGPYFFSNVLGCEPHDIRVGMALRARMQPHDSGLVVPVFYPL